MPQIHDYVEQLKAECEAAVARVKELEAQLADASEGIHILILQCDRYHAALERIADPNRALSYYDELAVIQSIATGALNPKP